MYECHYHRLMLSFRRAVWLKYSNQRTIASSSSWVIFYTFIGTDLLKMQLKLYFQKKNIYIYIYNWRPNCSWHMFKKTQTWAEHMSLVTVDGSETGHLVIRWSSQTELACVTSPSSRVFSFDLLLFTPSVSSWPHPTLSHPWTITAAALAACVSPLPHPSPAPIRSS